MKKFIISLFILLFLTSCQENKNNNINNSIKITPDQNIDLNAKSNKKTFIGFVGTFCSHCKDEMPIYEEFYKKNKDKVNMQIIVIDGKVFPGSYTIPQDINKPLTYEQATKEKCDYVPSYIIYDENKNIVDKKCGAKITMQDLETKLLTNNTGNTNTGVVNTGVVNTGSTDPKTSTGENLINNNNNMKQTQKFKDGDIGVIMTTSNGKIEIKLFPEYTPKTALNFLALSQKGYYNNLTFHRVIKDFMIQGGDPEGTGMGGKSIFGKEFEDEFSPELKNIRGSISMANAGPNTNGSQFFINHKDNNFLDNRHSVFGQVINGMENVDKIAGTKTINDKPEKEVKIIKIEVVKYSSGTLKPYTYSFEEETKKIEEVTKKIEEVNKTRTVKKGDKVEVNYIGKTTIDKKEFDNSYKNGNPLLFEVGSKDIISGFSSGVIGMKIGEKKTINIKAKDAYGEYDPKSIQELKKSDLKSFTDAGIKLEVGVKLPTAYGEFEIKEVKDDIVKLDINHFLAGKDLTFELELVNFK